MATTLIGQDRSPVEAYLALPWSYELKLDPEGGCWVVSIGELPDFFAAGESPAEAAGNARDALLSHLSSYLATGTPIPFPTLAPRPVVYRSFGVVLAAVA